MLWQFYNTIREIEATFRVLKTDLDLHPIYHKKDESTMAHLQLGLLAYWVVNTIRHQLKKENIHSRWSEIVRIMNTQKAVTTLAHNDKDQVIQIRCCSEPNQKVQTLYDALKYKYAPFIKKIFTSHSENLPKTPIRWHVLQLCTSNGKNRCSGARRQLVRGRQKPFSTVRLALCGRLRHKQISPATH